MEVNVSLFHMEVLILNGMETNCYVVDNTQTKEAIVVDPSDQATKIEQYLKENDLVCKAILLTHGHFDHIMACNELAKLTSAPVYAHKEEVELLENPSFNLSSRYGAGYIVTPDVLLDDEEELNLIGMKIKVIHTPGHTSGGVCFLFEEFDEMIAGDTLFYEEIGRYDLPTGDGNTLIASIKEKLLPLNPEIRVYPGHGPSTTIGHEKQYNGYLQD